MRSAAVFLIWIAAFAGLSAQTAPTRISIVDQTGLALPGVRIEVFRGADNIQSLTSNPEGLAELAPGQPDDVVEASLDGFETVRLQRSAANRIVLPLATTREVTDVVAAALTSSGSSMEHLGSTMATPLAMRLPTPRQRILQSLPFLPSVVRGRDGLLRIGGTRPHESSLWIDGFDVTDPVTSTTTIDLPNESVKGMAVVREPVSATFSGVLGSMASIETTAGTGEFRAGLQGFIPRPRLDERYGLGKIEAFFPRAYTGGRIGKSDFFASAELNFERIPVPGVTNSTGSPAAGTTGVTSFARVDTALSERQTLSFEGLFLPGTSSFSGLSPLRQAASSPDVTSRDIFGGVIDRYVLSPTTLLTLRVGVLNHKTETGAQGSGDAILQPSGWSQNWFSEEDTSGTRRSMSLTWDRSGVPGFGTHTFSVMGDIRLRSMTAALEHQTIRVQDDRGRLTRSIEFGAVPGAIKTNDTNSGIGLRDLWDITPRLQLDVDVRLDWYQHLSDVTPSPRIGLRYVLDAGARTTFKASAGRFVGRVPLGALTFSQFPVRTDSTFDPLTGLATNVVTFTPSARELLLPRADAVSLELERTIRPGLDAQAAVRYRRGERLPTIGVIPETGAAILASTGTSTYREFQVSLQQHWAPNRQLFVSYVRSESRGNLNDFGSLMVNLDTPFLEPTGTTVTSSDVPDRIRAWATTPVTLPILDEIITSPAVEWRTGFPYSVQDVYRHYVGTPNGERLPAYFSLDLTVFKTFDIFDREADLGLQFFNLTNHFNPRDVINVVDSPRFKELTNNPGFTLGGYMQVRW